MIKINLLDSVTERQAGAAIAVERKIGSPMSQLLMMTIAVAFLLVAVISWDVISTQMAKTKAESDLEEQKQVAVELDAMTKEMTDLKQKTDNITARIDAIKKLRDTQAGPSAVLEAMRERIAMVPGVYLASVEQTGEQLTIKGDSPDEAAVTQFGRSLEFSGGLFSNLNIETQRKEKPGQAAVASSASADAPPKQEIVGFTIRCAYTPSKAKASQNTATTASNQDQSPSAQPPPQVAAKTLPDAVRDRLPKPKTDGSTIPTPPQVAKN
ncbi:MAG: PilN domain-containing protein [Acidobacteriota bacterium]|nr:PilN domain-containing protein [Acidobacteriota bacterium]